MEVYMNKTVTSREDILAAGKAIAARRGLVAINMREVASECGVAVGSIYNYFPSKNDLMIATVEAVWIEIIQEIADSPDTEGFLETVEKLFCCVKSGGEKYPYFFSAHSMSVEKSGLDQGREVMGQYFDYIKIKLLSSLEADQRVKKEFFSERCTRTEFVEFVFSNLLSLLMQKQQSCRVLTEVIRGAVYGACGEEAGCFPHSESKG